MIEWYKKEDRCAVFLKIITEPVIKKERERNKSNTGWLKKIYIVFF